MSQDANSVDETYYEDQMEIVSLKMDNLALAKQNQILTSENARLKAMVETLAMENSCISTKNRRKTNPQILEKWRYYHDHKEEILKNAEKKPNWYVVKQISDRMYASEKTLIP